MFQGWRRELIGGVAAGVVLAVACSEEEERPGAPPPCNDPACGDYQGGNVPVGAVPDVGGSAGAAGAGGGPGMPPGSLVLAGSVRQISAFDPVETSSISGTVQVRAASDEAGAEPVATESDPGGSYRLEGVEQASLIWVNVGAVEGGAGDLYMDTLQAVEPAQSVDDLVVTPRALMLELAATSFTGTPIELDPTAAHVVVRFVDETDTPLSDVTIIYPPPELASIAYDAGVGIYSDTFEATEDRGVAVLANVLAVPYPGVTLALLAELDDVTHEVRLPIASGSVSVITAVIPNP